MTSVGGGEFSSPVTVSLREESTDDSDSVVVIVAVTLNLVLIIATATLIVGSVFGYKYWW